MNKTFFNRMTSSKEFEIWLKQKDQRLHHVSNRLTEALTHGYSIETINSLYSWLIASFSNLESAHDEESIYLLDCCSTYIGECFIYLYGGYWHLQSNKKDHAFGYPGIIDYRSSGNNKIPKHPHIWVTTSIHRRSNIIYDSFMKYDL